MSDEMIGAGSTFKIGNPVQLIALGNIEEFPDLPGWTNGLLDTSNFDTPDQFTTYMNNPWKDGEETDIVMKVAIGSDTDLACRNARADGKARPYEMLLPITIAGVAKTAKITGNLIVRQYKRTNPKADLRMATLTVKWISLPVEAVQAVPAP